MFHKKSLLNIWSVFGFWNQLNNSISVPDAFFMSSWIKHGCRVIRQTQAKPTSNGLLTSGNIQCQNAKIKVHADLSSLMTWGIQCQHTKNKVYADSSSLTTWGIQCQHTKNKGHADLSPLIIWNVQCQHTKTRSVQTWAHWWHEIFSANTPKTRSVQTWAYWWHGTFSVNTPKIKVRADLSLLMTWYIQSQRTKNKSPCILELINDMERSVSTSQKHIKNIKHLENLDGKEWGLNY